MARRVTVYGKVQGVFFRDRCRHEAERRGVSGWVQNAPDGSVGAFFEGPAEAVDSLVAWAHVGPSSAVVDRVAVVDAVPAGMREFQVRG